MLKIKRKELILEALDKNTSDFLNDANIIKLDATELSGELGIARYNVSRDLNQLFEENKVIKITSRPVLFFSRRLVEEKIGARVPFQQFANLEQFMNIFSETKGKYSKDYPFSELVGYSGSLANAVRQAKAALLYPPNGLHTLLSGPSGSGKTTFARFMYQYAVQVGQLYSNAPYVVFNCADYSNNQHLLLDHLFGHSKHAFTGAEESKNGLVEAANGGILFLDEIHRLPPEGQEMLFSIIDRGEFYRLGESEKPQKVNLLIIGATTENIQDNILTTFLRRIPLTINLPSINDRDLSERVQLIYFCFKQEAKNIEKTLQVNEDVVRFFLQYEPKGNIGELKNDIQLLCANALVDNISHNEKIIKVKLSHLSPYLIDQFYFSHSDEKSDSGMRRKLKFIKIGDLEFTPNDNNKKDPFLLINEDNGLSTNIPNIYQEYIDNEGTLASLKGQIQRHVQQKEQTNETNQQPIFKIVSRQNFEITLNILKKVAQQEDYYFDDNNIESLALHLDTLIEKVNEGYSFHDEKFLEHKKKSQVEKEKEFQIAKKIYQEVSSSLQVELPESETYFISLYLKAMNEKYTKQKIGVLVLMHGETAASDLAQTANKLLNVNHALGLNMPLSQTVGDTLESATKIVKEIDQGKGVVLLSDMGSLNMFGEIIMSKLRIQTKTIKMVTTPMVVEATRKAMLPEMTLEKLEQDIIEQSTFIGNSVQAPNNQNSENIMIEQENNRRDKIIYILEENLVFLESTIIYDLLEEQAKSIFNNFPIENYENFWIKFLFHTSNMIERAIRKEQFERNKSSVILKQDPNLYRFLKNSFSSIENRFAINIKDSEFSYLMELIDICMKIHS